MKGSIAFLIGCFIGSVVTQVWMDKHSTPDKEKVEKKDEDPKTEEPEADKSENTESKTEDKKKGFREQSTLDDYRTKANEERITYNTIVKAEYDYAESEHPTEDDDSLDDLHEQVKNNPPREISEKEFGTFGYAQETLVYDTEYELLELDDDSETPIDDPMDEYRIVGDVLKFSGFKTDPSLNTIWVRNYRLRTDYVIHKK